MGSQLEKKRHLGYSAVGKVLTVRSHLADLCVVTIKCLKGLRLVNQCSDSPGLSSVDCSVVLSLCKSGYGISKNTL